MEIQAWRTRKFIPTWGENNQSECPVTVRFTPPNVGWMNRWREAVVGMPNMESLDPTEQDADRADSLREWEGRLTSLRNEMVRDLVVGVDHLTSDGRDVPLVDALAFIEENPALSNEVFHALVAAGGVDIQQGKG